MMFKRLVAVLAVIALSAQVACAGLLPVDTDAMVGWTGTLSFASLGFEADVDYAVFEPGKFDGIDASAGYVYTYQIFNTSETGGLSLFSVELEDGSNAVIQDSDAGYDGGQIADLVVISDSFKVLFHQNALPAGVHSQVAIFTSEFGPTRANASIINSGRSDTVTGQAPTPVPEPCTLSLMAVAGIFLARKRRTS